MYKVEIITETNQKIEQKIEDLKFLKELLENLKTKEVTLHHIKEDKQKGK